MSVSEEDCREITAACEENGVFLAVCHVLRYFPPVVKIKEIMPEVSEQNAPDT